MIQKVYDILSGIGVPVQYILRPDISTTKTGISYHFFNEGYELYADGKGEEFGGVLQVDVFSTVDYSGTVRQVRERLEAAKFRLADMRDGNDGFEDSMKYYQKILILNYNEREVLENGS
jgi:hypothetical protein